MSKHKRIDVHQHIVPSFWADALPSHGGDPSGWSCPAWSEDSALAYMDSVQIETGILSLTAPSIKGWNGQAKLDMARKVNEYTANVVAHHPTRFGNFATLPLPDVDGSLAEINYALDVLKADGVVILSNYNGTYLGDSAFDQVWAELDRRKAVVFIHPTQPPMDPLAGVPGPMIDYPFDTTRTAVHMLLNGVLSRYPNVRIILSHAGGFVPYAAQRVAEVSAMMHQDVTPESVLEQLKSFYFDTALSSPSALPSLVAFARPDRLLFGSDFPYASAKVAATFTAYQDTSTYLSPELHHALDRNNALALFPRLANGR
ncbi:amidohydrolase family protein [Pseudomonas sp. s4]|uniref:amidohydrolase family protein n=1 Tax=Pseudomonas sp. s4 TaxID=353218 RepID=UPI00398CC1E3